MLKRDWTTFSSIINYSRLNNEHDYEDLCIRLRINEYRTSYKHD